MKALLTASALLLSACGSVVATTAVQLANLSPLTADPADFAVRVTLPDGLDVAPGTAVLSLKAQETPEAAPITEDYTLQRDADVFRVAQADLASLRALQAKANAWEAADSEAASGSLGIKLQPCRRGDQLSVDARVSVAIQIEQGGIFLPLIRNAPLSSVAEQSELDALGPCP